MIWSKKALNKHSFCSTLHVSDQQVCLCWKLPVCRLDPQSPAASSPPGKGLIRFNCDFCQNDKNYSNADPLRPRSSPSLVTRSSRWCWFWRACKCRSPVPFSPSCCSSASTSCWPVCSTTASWLSTCAHISERSSGMLKTATTVTKYIRAHVNFLL